MQQQIKDIALIYVGQKEISPNKGFDDPIFERMMKEVGWYKSAPWCAFFAKLVWKLAKQYVSHISGSAVNTFVKLDHSKEYEKTTKPIVGALVIWRSYKDGKKLSTGHIGIVTKVNEDNTFETVEGNTTDKGGREGIMVATRIRHYEWTRVNGLRLLGFINPIDPIQ